MVVAVSRMTTMTPSRVPRVQVSLADRPAVVANVRLETCPAVAASVVKVLSGVE